MLFFLKYIFWIFFFIEQLVRQEIMDQLPEVALFCHEEGPYLDFVVPQHILPHIVKLITDKFSQVNNE